MYNKTFKDTGYRTVGKSTKYKVAGLVPGSNYQFQVYGMSVCGQGDHTALKLETKIDRKYWIFIKTWILILEVEFLSLVKFMYHISALN